MTASKRINREMFEESLRQFLNGTIKSAEAARMCGISTALWQYRAKVYCERGGLDSSFWEHTSLDDKQKEEERFFSYLNEDYEEQAIEISKEDKKKKWQLSTFKNM